MVDEPSRGLRLVDFATSSGRPRLLAEPRSRASWCRVAAFQVLDSSSSTSLWLTVVNSPARVPRACCLKSSMPSTLPKSAGARRGHRCDPGASFEAVGADRGAKSSTLATARLVHLLGLTPEVESDVLRWWGSGGLVKPSAWRAPPTAQGGVVHGLEDASEATASFESKILRI